MLYWLMKRIFVGPTLHTLFRPWVVGAEHVPQEGPAILASNHLSFSDSLFLPLVSQRRITFPAKMEYFTGHGVKGWLQRAFFAGTGQIPIDRSGGNASDAALAAGLKILNDGGLFGIYPEGTRSPDGRLYRGKTGVARLALTAGVPVIPVAMVGTAEVQPIGQTVPRVRRVGVVFGAPLDFSRYQGMQDDHTVIRAVTDEIMYALMNLSGQQYVDEYAATVKRRRAQALLRSAAEATERATAEARALARESTERARAEAKLRAQEVSDLAREMTARAVAAAERARADVTERARARAAYRRGGRPQDAPDRSDAAANNDSDVT